MDITPSPMRPRKRRAINACAPCRSSKVRCDGNRPCERCTRNGVECAYHVTARDENGERLERLEAEVTELRDEVQGLRGSGFVGRESQGRGDGGSGRVPGPDGNARSRAQGGLRSVVDAGIVTSEQARLWYLNFFSGSQYLVPIFCERHDTLPSVTSRSAFLVDAIISIGCRAAQGFDSPIYRQLQSRLRDHLTKLLIDGSVPQIEDVQAITLMAAYSENGFVLIALALRFAMEIGLPGAVEHVVTGTATAEEERELYRKARVWHCVCNIELFFSLDGGKLPGITLKPSPRKIRSLVTHRERTAIDVRLLSQVELNMIRADAYERIIALADETLLSENEMRLKSIIDETSLELTLWLNEWATIVSTDPIPQQRPIALQNLHIQREWALATLHLKTLATSGIENIAFMTAFQRDLVRCAKDAAARHLQFILEDSSTLGPASPESSQSHGSTYLSTFRWTLDYVWAKCAFSVLLVLKLAILLRDTVAAIMLLLRDAHRVLEELKRVTVGHIAYFQILQTSIEKCEAALREYTAEQNGATNGQLEAASGAAEDEFQGYVPNEFVFEWDFPGLNLKHMPLGWQDLFIDIDSLF